MTKAFRVASFFWIFGAIFYLASCEAPSPTSASLPAAAQTGTASGVDGYARKRSAAAPQEERPGLGTRWGETRESQVRITNFRRANGARPFATATIHYNDAAGIRAMIGATAPARTRPILPDPTGELVSVELRDGSGRLLPGLAVGGRWFVIGAEGTRYSITVRNRTAFRIEVVLSVDGLDVLDGRGASFGKRGYIVPARGRVRVEGFRQSMGAVAAFRFSSVAESYANRKYGETRNVGVIGIAVFNEYGTEPLEEEARRRLRADPFPESRFATPPLGR